MSGVPPRPRGVWLHMYLSPHEHAAFNVVPCPCGSCLIVPRAPNPSAANIRPQSATMSALSMCGQEYRSAETPRMLVNYRSLGTALYFCTSR